ncbi:probable receptor-like protein kinase At5g18500 [Dioscorea cayenensis subsp. rotundata]|uniref:non-specific serine/threonine protein kinase n=1 Tax=Dioscorea cayennensis subsp. rotundata TaxID=55577 RepID=A0AB40C940_DIOCR|nr:probable receptor-like protein kinase At5g18500 [Dioscorea cayenensis subsp. rotundata]
MSSSGSSLKEHLTKKTDVFGLELWEIIGITVMVFIICVLAIVVICTTVQSRKRRTRRTLNNLPITQIPAVSKEIKEVRVEHVSSNNYAAGDGMPMMIQDKNREDDSNKLVVHLGKSKNADYNSHSGSFHHTENGSQSGEEGSSGTVTGYRSSSYPITAPSPLAGLPEISQLGWGHWFTLRDLEIATNRFSRENILGEGGYGVVYRGSLINGIPVAVKRLLNNMGQAEKEFRVEVEAIGHVRHKNLVRLLGYCIEGTQRMLVYEYVNNGNLEQWLHGAMRQHGSLTWEARIKILLGTAKALAYLHEAIEPKVVHRDIKSSNILIDDGFNAKVSDFGLAKLLGAGKSHIATRVMGTFGYVAPEYANSGLLNEKSDIYSFGVVLLEAITGRDPVDYSRPSDEVNLVDWLKMMVGSRRSEEVVDPSIETKPSTRVLKRALLIALRCVDPDPDKRPRMSQVVRMLESDDPIPREDRRRRHNHGVSTEAENSDTDKSDNPDSKSDGAQDNRPSSIN